MRCTAFLLALVMSVAAAAEEWQREVEATIARTYPGLARLEMPETMLHALYYPAARAEVIRKKRSELPQDHPLFVEASEDIAADDLVLLRVPLGGEDGGSHYILFSEGPSADPEFYVFDNDETPLHFGATIMVVPGDGTLLTFGRHNALFVQRHLFRVAGGKPVEVKQPLYYVGLRSTATTKLTLRSEPKGGHVITELAPGDPVEVLAANLTDEQAYLVKTQTGLVGWIELEAVQEQPAIKGMEWMGD